MQNLGLNAPPRLQVESLRKELEAPEIERRLCMSQGVTSTDRMVQFCKSRHVQLSRLRRLRPNPRIRTRYSRCRFIPDDAEDDRGCQSRTSSSRLSRTQSVEM